MKYFFLKSFLIAFIFLLILPQEGQSQFSDDKLDLNDPDQTHIIIPKTGKRVKGKILSIKNEEVTIQSNKIDSIYQFTLGQIRRIRVQENLFVFDNDFDSLMPPTLSLFFTNTAFAMKKNQNSYRTFLGNSMMYSNQASDNVEIGFGYSFPFFFHGKLKITGNSIGKNSRHGVQITMALSPVILFNDDELGPMIEISQVNTWGNEDKFLNLTFNYYEIGIDQSMFDNNFYTKRFFSAALGSGLRVGKNLQVLLNKNVNFNQDFLEANLIPSIGLSWTIQNHNITFGYMSSNDIGLDFYPIFNTTFDDFLTFENGTFAKFPFFSYSRIFKKNNKE